MLSFEDARAVRDNVLARDDAERSFGVDNGMEYGCWRITGAGWTARLSSYWDLQAAGVMTPASDRSQDKSLELERFELFLEGVEGSVLEFHYRLDDASQKIVTYRCGRWEREFGVTTFKPKMSTAEAKRRALGVLAA